MIEYVTKSDIRLRIGRIPRQLIDRFIADNPEPEPPMIVVTAWADVDEEVPNYDDPAYILARQAWALKFGDEQFDLIAGAVEIVDDVSSAGLSELCELLGLPGDADRATTLRYGVLADADEMNGVVNLVLYNSTVTIRGLAEAAQVYNVTWRGGRVTVYGPGKGKARASQAFNDRSAAQWAHYRWDDFCELSGPKQSEIVAHYRLVMRLEELAARQ